MLKTLAKTYLPNLVRHGAQAGAGYLVAQGIATSSQADVMTAGALAVGAVLWSWAEKKGLLKVRF